MTIFGLFLNNFCVYPNCKPSSLRSQCWMRLFGRFSTTVVFSLILFTFEKLSFMSKTCWDILYSKFVNILYPSNLTILFTFLGTYAFSLTLCTFLNFPQCLKITQNVAFIFFFWHFPSIFILLKVICRVTLFDRKLQVYTKSPKLTIFGLF